MPDRSARPDGAARATTTLPTAAMGSLASLVPSWERSLRARNRSPKTIKGYVEAANLMIAFLADRGMPTAADAVTGR